MLNELTLIGRLTKDIQMSYLPSGMAVAKTSLAINEKYQDKENATFIDLRFFGKNAELANQYLQKGRMVFIKGKLRIDDYQNDKGEDKKAVYCLVEKMVFLDNIKNSNQNFNVSDKTQNQVSNDNQDGYVEIKDNGELPF